MLAADGLRTDERMAAAGFTGGFTTSALGSMHDAGARAKTLERAGLGSYPAYLHKQVHGKLVLPLSAATAQPADADGWLVDAAGRVAVVYAADCTPIFLWDKKGRAGAVLHSGWKGTLANIAGEGVRMLSENGIPPADLEAYIGPRAGACCYAVSDDFEQKFPATSLDRRGGKLYFDLGKEAKSQLVEAGVLATNVVVDTDCTVCSSGSAYFSYRRARDGQRMMGFLAKTA